MQTLMYDLRFAARQLGKAPGMALLAIVTLALGIGANTAIFTVIESVLLRPLPYPDSNRLVYIGPAGSGQAFGSTSWMNFRDIRAQSKLLKDVAGYSEDLSVIENRGSSESVVAPRMSANLFTMLSARPLLGRTFTEAEGQTAARRLCCYLRDCGGRCFTPTRGLWGEWSRLADRNARSWE